MREEKTHNMEPAANGAEPSVQDPENEAKETPAADEVSGGDRSDQGADDGENTGTGERGTGKIRGILRALKNKITGANRRKTIAVCCVGAAIVVSVTAAVAAMPQERHDGTASVPPSAAVSTKLPEPSRQKTEKKPARTPAPSRVPTATPVPTAPPYVHVDFSNSMIIGSSTTEALYIHGVIPEADYLYGTGLTVETIFQKSMPGSDVPIIEELNGDKKYDQVFLAFGLNELGWSDVRIFLEYYAQVVAAVRRYQPQAVIYIESVLPVGIGTSQRNRFGVNQDRINEYNALLGAFAQENGAYFLDVSSEMKGPDGYLPQDAAADGIHPNLESCGKWAALLKQKAEEVLNGPDAPVLADVENTDTDTSQSAPASEGTDVPVPAAG